MSHQFLILISLFQIRVSLHCLLYNTFLPLLLCWFDFRNSKRQELYIQVTTFTVNCLACNTLIFKLSLCFDLNLWSFVTCILHSINVSSLVSLQLWSVSRIGTSSHFKKGKQPNLGIGWKLLSCITHMASTCNTAFKVSVLCQEKNPASV